MTEQCDRFEIRRNAAAVREVNIISVLQLSFFQSWTFGRPKHYMTTSFPLNSGSFSFHRFSDSGFFS